MVDKCTKNITSTEPTPADEKLFSDGKVEPLPRYKTAEFHTIIDKGLFVSKRDRNEIHPTIADLCIYI